MLDRLLAPPSPPPTAVPTDREEPTSAGIEQPERPDIDAHAPADVDDPIDVRDLLRRYTVEELSEAADLYYRDNIDALEYFFAKPAWNVDEAPDLLACFAQVLAGVRPLRGMRVLDFGAGPGWTSRFLTQLGCEVVVCDVSATALDVSRQLFARQPVAGTQPTPTFLHFDGRHLDLPDESIDRIICIDAFHHVPNPKAVLGELGRVLRPGGIAGFQEPGPSHSTAAQSQYEMKNFTVIENDIRMRDISGWASDAGFTSLKLAIFTPEPFHTSIDLYEDYLGHGVTVEQHYEHQRRFVQNRRVFFLSRGAPVVSDSRERNGLVADLRVNPDSLAAARGSLVRVQLTARNIGTSVWLPSDAPVGPVLVGSHLYAADGHLLERDHSRFPLPGAGGSGVAPGEQIIFDTELPVPDAPGDYTVEIDLVSELVCWFEFNETIPATLRLRVT